MAVVQGARALFRHWVREEARALAGWAAAAALLAAGLGVLALRVGQLGEFLALFERNLERLPAVLRLLGGKAALRDPSALVLAALFRTAAPVLLLVWSSSAVLRIYTAEASAGTLEFLLSLPVTRVRLLAARIAAYGLGLAVLVAALSGGAWVGMVWGGGTVSGTATARAGLGLFVLFACLGGLGFLVSLAFRDHTQGLLALLGVQFLLFAAGTAVEGGGEGVWGLLNPYGHYAAAREWTGGAAGAWGELGVLAAGAAVLWWLGGVVFVRRQL